MLERKKKSCAASQSCRRATEWTMWSWPVSGRLDMMLIPLTPGISMCLQCSHWVRLNNTRTEDRTIFYVFTSERLLSLASCSGLTGLKTVACCDYYYYASLTTCGGGPFRLESILNASLPYLHLHFRLIECDPVAIWPPPPKKCILTPWVNRAR